MISEFIHILYIILSDTYGMAAECVGPARDISTLHCVVAKVMFCANEVFISDLHDSTSKLRAQLSGSPCWLVS